MKRALTTYILLTLLLCSCNNNTNTTTLYQRGVSQELAAQRKATIKDVEYSLQFNIPECKESAITGNIDIEFELDTPQEIIIDFREEQNVATVLANGNTTAYELRDEHIIIPANAVKSGKNRIGIAFTAGNQSLNRNNDFLYTLLVPDRARTVFPCFDQPDMKAIFRFTLQLPEAWTAISNSPVTSEDCRNGYKHITFAPTEPLSSYLFSFVAGVFQKETYKHIANM